jgi:sulfate transport system substrate-binding protein
MNQEILPAFQEYWRTKTGEDVVFQKYFSGSGTITQRVIGGAPADVMLLSTAEDALLLEQAGAVTSDWRQFPHGGIVCTSPFVIVVRAGNPKGIHGYSDLARPGVEVVQPDPLTSGGGQWAVLAEYGSVLKLQEKQGRPRNEAEAEVLLAGIRRNTVAAPASAREARELFDAGYGDALVTYEYEYLSEPISGRVEPVYPEASIIAEHPVVIIDRNVDPETRTALESFVQFLWGERAQRALVKYGFRAAANPEYDRRNPRLGRIPEPFTVDDLGGWEKAYGEVIMRTWKERILPVREVR